MVSIPTEIANGNKLVAPAPEVDFALVLSRVIGSVSDDPAQLRNVVYELARIRLEREVLQTNPPINPLETRHLTLALESAIERVEAIHSKHDNLKAMQSLDRLTDRSEPRKSVLIINRTSPTLDTDHLPSFTREPSARSEERRVGKEWRSRCATDAEQKKKKNA